MAKDKLTSIEIVSDGGKVLKTIPVDGYSADLDFTLTSATATYFYVRVKDAEEKIANADYVAYTAPVWTGLTPDEEDVVNEEKANAVVKMIDVLGTITLDSKDALAEARAAYDSLTDAQKALVGNYEVLTEAEKAYQTLLDESEDPDTEDGSDPPNPATGVVLGSTASLLAVGAAIAMVSLRKKKKTDK